MNKKIFWLVAFICVLTLSLWLHHRHSALPVTPSQITAQTGVHRPARRVAQVSKLQHPRVTTLLAKVEPGDDVISILHKYGFSDVQSHNALVESKLPAGFVLAPKETYRVTRDKSGRLNIRFFDPQEAVAYDFWRLGKNSGGQLQPVHYDIRLLTVRGHVRGSLVQSIANKIGNDLVAYRFMDAFLLQYNLRKVVKRNAAFSLTVEKLYEGGQFVRFGQVRRAAIEISGRMVTRVYRPLQHGGIFVAQSLDTDNRPFYAPVNHIHISSFFSWRRFDPVEHRYAPHLGIDLQTAAGKPIFSIAPGFVLRFGRRRAAGQFVVLQHANGYQSFYDHLSKIADIHRGEHVSAGAILGYIGCTGWCTGPHLHFAIKRFGKFINPIHLIRGYAFDQRRAVLSLISKR